VKKFIFIPILLFSFAFHIKAQRIRKQRQYDGGIFTNNYSNIPDKYSISHVSYSSTRVSSSNYSLGDSYLGQGDYEKAIQFYTKALNESNYFSKIDIYFKRGYAKYQAQQFDDAIAKYCNCQATQLCKSI
jgi:tetratricopeptide (TPR) repeat protein